MDDIKHVFKDNYLRYASYVILDRAIPNVIDGLKPVQRRILWTLFKMDDGKLHKVANVAGQTMALHPHGDAAIIDALVNLANKGYLLDTQGNFGNVHTGDPAAAARYIESRLAALAKETLFNTDLMSFIHSYDGRAKEPVVLPAKVPLLLLLGSEGIAVGMSTKILPHNFVEIIQSQIAILEGKSFKLYPDFPSGGLMDPSEYNDGQGKVRVRAKITSPDDKTLLISEICYGTTTESLIHSIDEAAKKGKLKIDSINDYTAENIEIEVKLPRGQHSDKVIEQLYAFTDCEITINSSLLCIKDNLPWEGSVTQVLNYQVELLQGYLKKELDLEEAELLEKIFEKTLERIFIENRLYKHIEKSTSYDHMHDALAKSLKQFHANLARIPTKEDQDRLLSIPIRRISQYDLDKNKNDTKALESRLATVQKQLKNVKKFTINYLKNLLKNYQDQFSRRTKIIKIAPVDKKAVYQNMIKVGYDLDTGYVGTKVSGAQLECSPLDKLLLLFSNGSYCVINIPQKQYLQTEDKKIIWVGVADKSTIINVVYSDKKTKVPYIKRFIVKKFILDKEYHFLDIINNKIELMSTDSAMVLSLEFLPEKGKKLVYRRCAFSDIDVKGVETRGVRLAKQRLKNVKVINKERVK